MLLGVRQKYAHAQYWLMANRALAESHSHVFCGIVDAIAASDRDRGTSRPRCLQKSRETY